MYLTPQYHHNDYGDPIAGFTLYSDRKRRSALREINDWYKRKQRIQVEAILFIFLDISENLPVENDDQK